MKQRPPREDRFVAYRIVAIYALFSCLWIFLSDNVLGILIPSPALIVRYSVYKGFLYIAVTSYLIYHLLARYIRKIIQAEDTLKKLNEELEVRVAKRTEELEENRMELEMQNEELLETYQGLEAETAKRIGAMEVLARQERMLMQQSRMAAMGEVLGNIAHQWRQPLNVLGLKIQYLGFAHEMGDFNKEMLERSIGDSMAIIQHLSRTIDDFREFSSPDKVKTLFTVSTLVQKAVSLILDSLSERHIAIDVEAAGDHQVNGYPNEFVQALLNILMNSRDALVARGTPGGRISVRSLDENGRAVVTIADNAGGIGDEILPKIFDAYFTTKDLGKGTGVGLFMSKTIIEKGMGGSLTVKNIEGGVEFRVEV